MAIGHSPSIYAGAPRSQARTRLGLISEFQLRVDGVHVSVPHGVQRLLAFLAMAARPVARSRVAGQLWLDVPECRALGNLRSALWRLRRIPRRIVFAIDDRLGLDDEVEVDMADIAQLTSRLIRAPDRAALARLPDLVAAAELLPGWGDEWIIVERERFRELRLHALEQAGELLLEAGDRSTAIEAAMAAIDTEPFRDSAQRLLVRGYLDDGNGAAALRAYYAYRDLLAAELGIEPSDSMQRLVARLGRDPKGR